MKQDEQQFLNDLDKHLWNAADKLRANVDAAVYKHVVLGLIFLKYISDAFKERHAELEARDYYTEKKVFWVPALARWDFTQGNAKVAVGTKLHVKNGKASEYAFKGIGRLLDDALEAEIRKNLAGLGYEL